MCSWLDRSARNTAIDLARQQARASALPFEVDIEDPKNIHRESEIRKILDGTLRAILDLPQSLRELLILSVPDELSAPQIAERLQISAAAARQRISLARKREAKGDEVQHEAIPSFRRRHVEAPTVQDVEITGV